jgi:hypothetical protein
MAYKKSNANGQATSANSEPVVIASDQSAVATTQTYNPADYFPRYGRNDIGATLPNVDPFGSLQIRGPVLTEEGMGRINFTGSSLTNTIGTATFTTGSQVVTGTGFATTYNLHQGDHVRLDADTDYDWAQIALVVNDTTLYLNSPYTGTGGSGAASYSPVAKLVGSGASLTVSNGQLTFATGTTADSETMIFSPVLNGPAVVKIAASISQRIVNQSIYLGYERSPFITITEFARFKFTGTTNTQVICESGYNPYTAPTANETETTTITIPNGDTTATINTYKIELQTDQVIFSINGFVVATHTKRIPHIMKGSPYGNWLSMRTVNGSTPPAGSTNYVIDYAFGRAFNRLDVSQSSPGDSSSSQVVSQRNATSTFDTLQSAAAGTGNGVALYVDGMATAMFTVTGSGSWTVTFEGTEDGTNWYSLNTNRQGTDTIGSTATNATTGTYKADVSGFQYIRARVSTFASGTATVTCRTTPAPSTSRVVNANITASQTLGTVTTVGTVTTLTNGGIAHDAADSGNPHKIGTKAVAQLSAQTLVAANDRSNAFSDLDGAMLTRADAPLGDVVSGNASNTDGTSTSVLASGGAGIKHYITDVTLTNTSATNIYVELKDGTTAKWVFPVPANGGVTHHFRTPLAGTAATAWNFDPSAAATTVYCSVAGFKSKV